MVASHVRGTRVFVIPPLHKDMPLTTAAAAKGGGGRLRSIEEPLQQIAITLGREEVAMPAIAPRSGHPFAFGFDDCIRPRRKAGQLRAVNDQEVRKTTAGAFEADERHFSPAE